jgi:hypothetical protein
MGTTPGFHWTLFSAARAAPSSHRVKSLTSARTNVTPYFWGWGVQICWNFSILTKIWFFLPARTQNFFLDEAGWNFNFFVKKSHMFLWCTFLKKGGEELIFKKFEFFRGKRKAGTLQGNNRIRDQWNEWGTGGTRERYYLGPIHKPFFNFIQIFLDFM